MRRRLALRFVLFVAAVLFFTFPTHAQTAHEGQTANGAYYRIAVPDGWTPSDGLVIWNHGFDLSPVGPEVDLGPLVDVQLAEGYAVAASSYSLNGWALFQTAEDNRQLLDAFEELVGEPDQILIYGASLGGIVTARDIEEKRLGNVVGALPICGALSGSRVWDAGLDLRLLYDYICDGVPGAAIPGGAAGLPFPPDPAFDQNALGGAVHACTGILAPPSGRTAEQQARLDELLQLTGIPEAFLLTDMGFVTFALADLVYDPRKLDGQIAGNNAQVDYGDPAVNAGIARVAADNNTRTFLFDNYVPSGKVGNVKIVSLHTDKDGLIIVENERDYAAVVPPGNLTTGIVVEDQPTHCGFTEAELVASWETLRGWVAGLPQPTPADIQATCQALDAGDLAAGPCRIDPGFIFPEESRIRPRGDCVPDAQTLCLGKEDRFRVTVDWDNPNDGMGPGSVAAASESSGTFYFFNPDNWELSVKVLNGRQINGHFWVFYGSLTNVEFELRVIDTETALEKVYRNPPRTFASRGDTNAF